MLCTYYHGIPREIVSWYRGGYHGHKTAPLRYVLVGSVCTFVFGVEVDLDIALRKHTEANNATFFTDCDSSVTLGGIR